MVYGCDRICNLVITYVNSRIAIHSIGYKMYLAVKTMNNCKYILYLYIHQNEYLSVVKMSKIYVKSQLF